MKPNKTPWVDRNVETFSDALLNVAPDPSWLPESEQGVVEEFGCGHYGCVMPTGRDDTVFKLTTDPAEAAFVRVAIELSDKEKHGGKWDFGDWPAGMVRYKAIYQLAGATYYRRPIFALWREEAFDIGEPLSLLDTLSAYDRDTRKRGRNLLIHAKMGAEAVREWFKKHGTMFAKRHEDMAWDVVGANFELLEATPYKMEFERRRTLADVLTRFRGAERAAVGMRIYDACIEMMEYNNPVLSTVGATMSYYREQAIVLADVHTNNIGYVEREDHSGRVVAITDPGHAVFLDDRYDGLSIEELQA